MKHCDNRITSVQRIGSSLAGVVLLVTALLLHPAPPASWAWDPPDPCSGGCVCLGGCGPQWPEGGGDVDLRRQELQRRTTIPRPPKPPTKSPRRKALEDQLERDRNALKRRIKMELIRTHIKDRPSVAPDYSRPYGVLGTAFFGLGQIEPDMRDYLKTLKAPGPLKTRGTPISRENLRRTVAIVGAIMNRHGRAAKTGMPDMDLYFLAGEAARAMNGHDLQVRVPEAVLPAVNPDQEARLRHAKERLDQAWNALATVMAQRTRLEEQLFALHRRARKSGEPISTFRKRNRQQLAHYAKIFKGEAEARSRLMEAQALFKKEVILHAR